MRVNGMRSLFSYSAVCSADCRLHGDGPLERQKPHRKSATLPPIFPKNQSRHYINAKSEKL